LPTGIAAAAAAYLLLATTIGFGWLDSWHDEQRAAQICLLALAAAACTWLLLVRPSIAAPHLSAPVLITLTLGLVSSLRSDRPLSGLAEVSLFGLLCVLAALTAAFARATGAAGFRWVSRGALLIAAGHVVGAFTRYAAAIGLDHSLGVEIWLVGFSNPRVASSFYALLLPFIALATMPRVEPDHRLRAAAWALLLGLWTVAAGLEARALWLSYGVALSVLLSMSWTPSGRRVALTLAATAVGGGLLQFGLQQPFLEAAAAAAPNSARDLASLSARDILWRLAAEAVTDAPLLGIGPGQFTQFESYAGAHPHNWVLQLAAEWGLPALLAVLTGLVALLRRLWPAIKDAPRDDPTLAAASLSVLVGFVSALVDGTLVMPVTQVQFALAFGLMLGLLAARHPTTDAMDTRSTATHVAAACAIAGAALTLSWHALSTYPLQAAEKAAFQQRFPGQWRVPRFWENGLTLAQPREDDRD
jgi:O-antigen ligase